MTLKLGRVIIEFALGKKMFRLPTRASAYAFVCVCACALKNVSDVVGGIFTVHLSPPYYTT